MIIYYKRVLKNLPLQVVGANFFLILSGCIAVLTSSCNKSSVIGLDVQPDNVQLNVSFIDTTTLITKTERVWAIRSDEYATQTTTTDALIGTYLDPVFGKTSASLYTQLKLNTLKPSFGTNPKIDNIILSLVYDTIYYGERHCAKQNINVHQITTGNFNTDNAYYSSDSLPFSPFDLANNFSFSPEPLSSSKLDIPLDRNFGQDILDHQSSAAFNDGADFHNYIAGLYITTQNTTSLNAEEGNILRFKMDDIDTKLILYYHNDESPLQSSSSFEFSFNNVARFSGFTHDYSVVDANLTSQLSSTPPVQNDVVFLQPMAGTRVKIEMPYLMNWLNQGKIGINQAELVIKVNTSLYSLTTFSPPSSLILYGINDEGNPYKIADANEGPDYYGGTYSSSTNKYSFNIARYIQQVLDGKLHNNGMYLMINNEFINPGRVVIGGGSSGDPYQMKLNITRTKLP